MATTAPSSSNHSHLAAIADRHLQSGASTKAARFYRLAGEQAATAYANDPALEYYTSALSLTPDNNLQARFTLLLARERLYALLGRPEGQQTDLTSLSTLADHLDDARKRAIVAVRHAAYREISGDYAAAIALAQLATWMAREIDHAAAQAEGHLVWGKALLRQSNYAAAREQLHKALTLAQESSQQQLAADCYRSLGVVANDQGQFPLAIQQYDQALAIYEELGDRLSQSHILTNLGHIDQSQSKLSSALGHWQAAQRLYAELGDREGNLRILINLSSSSMDLGYYKQAQTYNEEALTIAEETKILLGACFAQLNLGLIAHYQNENGEAERRLRAGLAIAEQLGSKRLQGHALSVLGHALLALDRIDEAQLAYWEALAIWRELDLPNLAAETLSGMARLAQRQQNIAAAMSHVNEIVTQMKVDRRLDGAEAPARIYLTAYRVLSEATDPRAAEMLTWANDYLQQLIATVEDDGSRTSLTEAVAANRELLAAIA